MARPSTAKPTKTPDPAESTAEPTTAGKGQPTPSRREKEAARKRPLVSNDRAAARKASREAMAAQRDRARIGLANGEEKYLPMRDRGPQKRYVRDYVDARFSVGEFLIPMMFIIIILTFIPSPDVQLVSLIALWGFFLVAVADVVILGLLLRRKLAAKFGAERVERVRWYAAMRALQLRLMRLPKPQVKRGQYPA